MFCAKAFDVPRLKHGTTACIENNSDEQQKANASFDEIITSFDLKHFAFIVNFATAVGYFYKVLDS